MATGRAGDHARHFTHLLGTLRPPSGGAPGVIVAPFDTELFGHWWFEGVDFLGATYRRLREQSAVRPMTASEALRDGPARAQLQLAEGSWGANGDHSMWLNDGTAWTWQRLWPLEDAFWDVAPAALAIPAARPILAQAARELLLAQASDWQFIISTGAVADYGERRFRGHCYDAEQLVAALQAGVSGDGSTLHAAALRVDELSRRDDVFPDILTSVAAALQE
jgi:1,4-alpha-glucan branching enzyme